MSQVVAVKVVEDGFLSVCDCGIETHVVTVAEDRRPTPLEFAYTCDGCGESHWFTIQPYADLEPCYLDGCPWPACECDRTPQSGRGVDRG
jgi:hypothetical protein